jgi:multiple antibiotic resistance protein
VEPARESDKPLDFLLSFIPLFFAIDVIGAIPIFMSLTQGMTDSERARVVRQACVTALTVAVAFVFLGEWLFRMLSVTTSDFRMAGGSLLLVFAIQDLTVGGKPRRTPTGTVGVVPLGMPLLVGPGVLTTSLLVAHNHGYPWALAALVANIALVFVVLSASELILRIVKPSGAAAVGKIAALFLAAIGVMLVRAGVEETIRAFQMKP